MNWNSFSKNVEKAIATSWPGVGYLCQVIKLIIIHLFPLGCHKITTCHNITL